jgi:hypothetical protein
VARIRRSKVGREKEDKIFLLQRRQRHEGGKIVNFQNITNCLAKETKLVVQYIGLGYGSGRVLGVFRIRSARGILVSETRLHWTVPAGSQDLGRGEWDTSGLCGSGRVFVVVVRLRLLRLFSPSLFVLRLSPSLLFLQIP